MRSARQRASVLAIVVALVAAVYGCDGGPTEPKTPEGTYGLSTVNGKPLPFTLFSDTGYQVIVVSGSVDLAPSGAFTATGTTREVVDGFTSTYVDTTAGRWTRADNGVISLVSGGDTSRAVWQGKTLTFEVPTGTGSNFTFIYSRR